MKRILLALSLFIIALSGYSQAIEHIGTAGDDVQARMAIGGDSLIYVPVLDTSIGTKPKRNGAVRMRPDGTVYKWYNGAYIPMVGGIFVDSLWINGGTSHLFYRKNGVSYDLGAITVLFTETDPLFYTRWHQESTDSLPEGANNKYFTTVRARTSISQGVGIGYDPTTGIITNTAPGITSLTIAVPTGFAVSPVPLTGSGTITISLPITGMLRGTGTGVATTSILNPLVFSGGNLSINIANGSQPGAISASDWTTFSNKVSPTRQITINGITQNLNSDQIWTVTPSFSGTNQSFVDGTGAYQPATVSNMKDVDTTGKFQNKGVLTFDPSTNKYKVWQQIDDSINRTKDTTQLYQLNVAQSLTGNGWTRMTNWQILATETLVSDGIQIANPGPSSGTNFAYSPWKSGFWDVTEMIEYRVVSRGAGDSYIGAVFAGTTTYFNRWQATLFRLNTSQIYTYTDATGFGPNLLGTAPFTINNGDIIRVYFRKKGMHFITTVFDVTQNQIASFSEDDSGIGANINHINPGVYLLNCTAVIRDMKFWANDKRPEFLMVGASIQQAFWTAPTEDSTLPGRMNVFSNRKFGYTGGSGAGFADWLATVPEIMKLKPNFIIAGDWGYNDINLGSLSAPAWQGLYKRLADTLLRTGSRLILEKQPPANNAIPATLNIFIDTAMAKDKRIQIWDMNHIPPAWDSSQTNNFNATYFNDALGHPNQAGVRVMQGYLRDFIESSNRLRLMGAYDVGIYRFARNNRMLLYDSVNKQWRDYIITGGYSISGDSVNFSGGSGAVLSVFSRTGVVTAQTGDYTAAQVTNAVSTASTYSDPAWITSLALSKVISIPTVNKVVYSNGTTLVGDANFTYATTGNGILQQGNLTGASTTTPAVFNQGGTYSSVNGANLKNVIFDNGTVQYGTGVSTNQFDFMIKDNLGAYVFYTGSSPTVKFQVTNGGVITVPGLGGSGLRMVTVDNSGNFGNAAIPGGGGGVPGGANLNVQFNDASAFNGENYMSYEKATHKMILGRNFGTASSYKTRLEVWQDSTNATYNDPQVLLTGSNRAVGMTLSTLDRSSYIGFDAAFNASTTQWKTINGSNGQAIIYKDQTGVLRFYGDNSGSSNTAYTPTERMDLVLTNGHLNIGTTLSDITPSMFSVQTTTAGSIPAPSMTTTQRNAISSPVEGLQVWDNSFHQLWAYANGAWAQVGGGGAGLSGMTATRVQVANNATTLVDYANFTYDGNLLKLYNTDDVTGMPTPQRLIAAKDNTGNGNWLTLAGRANQTNANTTGGPQGVEGYAKTSHSTGNVVLSIGAIGNVEHAGAGTVTGMRGVQGGVVVNAGGGTITGAAGIYSAGVTINGLAGSTVTDAYSGYFDANVNSSTVGGNFVRHHGIYQIGTTDDNIFYGPTSVGKLSLIGGMSINNVFITNANYTSVSGDFFIGIQGLTGAHTVTMNTAAMVQGQLFWIQDVDGTCSGTNTITLSGITLNGVSGPVINTAYGSLKIMWVSGSNFVKW